MLLYILDGGLHEKQKLLKVLDNDLPTQKSTMQIVSISTEISLFCILISPGKP